jgi:hypothetical protein
MKAKSIKGKNAAEIKTELEKSMSDSFEPTVAIVFLEADIAHDGICSVLSEKEIQIFGCSTGSNFTDGEIESGCIVVLLLSMDTKYFRVKLATSATGTVKEFAEDIAKTGLAAFSKPAFLIVSGGMAADGDEIVEGIENICGNDATIFGGLAADSLKMIRTFVFTNNQLSDHGLIALIVDEEKISLSGMAVGGWRPVGTDYIITKSNGNILYTINNEPALQFISRYAGIKDFFGDNMANISLSANFQLQLQRPGKHPVMRTPMYANPEDHSIVFAGSLPEGSKVRLSMLPGFDVIDTARKGFAEYKKDEPDADALIMFSCAGRQVSLGPYASDEIEGIKEIWNAPMAGFFCFGEIGRVEKGNTEFQNMTCSLAILKEK